MELRVWDRIFLEITSYMNFDGSVESEISNLVGQHSSFACTEFQVNLEHPIGVRQNLGKVLVHKHLVQTQFLHRYHDEDLHDSECVQTLVFITMRLRFVIVIMEGYGTGPIYSSWLHSQEISTAIAISITRSRSKFPAFIMKEALEV